MHLSKPIELYKASVSSIEVQVVTYRNVCVFVCVCVCVCLQTCIRMQTSLSLLCQLRGLELTAYQSMISLTASS
jgi:hypothetical protein